MAHEHCCHCSKHEHDEKKHHHAHGHGDACACAACNETEEIFTKTEEEFKRQNENFKKEIKFLALCFAIFIVAETAEFANLAFLPELARLIIFAVLYLLVAPPVLKEAWHAMRHGDFFNEFTLMGLASLAAMGIGEISESVGVMLFYRIGEALQDRAASKSGKSIKHLLAEKPLTAQKIVGQNVIEVSPKEIVAGDHVLVKPGEAIPVDGVIINGESNLDTSSLTGESLPRFVANGDSVNGGTISLDGRLIIEATGPFEDNLISRVIESVQNAVAKKSPTERFITRFAKIYTPCVFFLAVVVAIFPPLFLGGNQAIWLEWFKKALVLLVISCPCALVISIPLGFFGGIGCASKNGILVKGAYVFDKLAKVDTAVFDKTGTLTEGKFAVTNLLCQDGVTKDDLLQTAYLTESASNHPVSRAIVAEIENSARPVAEDGIVTQIPGKGLIYKSPTQEIISGNATLLAEYNIKTPEIKEVGTLVFVAKNGKLLGTIIVKDMLRSDSLPAIEKIRLLGIKRIYLLTGDRDAVAAGVAEELKLDGYKADLLPHEKVAALAEISGSRETNVIYVGDGVNDGPVLVTSETGIAMGGFGSRVAVEASDVVILDDSPMKVATLIKIARKTRRIVYENIGISFGVKILVLVLGLTGLLELAGIPELWVAVFADVGVCLLAILNATRAMKL
ncbi:MAG: heavy metal translocating P-type ATPase [Synergistaceae bacterium]|nr:heavy metal translocating P-type ATPase [Synergistaceae bacterium]